MIDERRPGRARDPPGLDAVLHRIRGGGAEVVRGVFEELALGVQWQQVEDGRANVVGTWAGGGEG